MQQTITRNQLYQFEHELINLQKNNPLLTLLLQPRIKLFLDRSSMHSKVMHSRFQSIQEKYIQKDDAGNFLLTGEGETKEWKYIESKVDLEKAEVLDVSMVKEAFNKECAAFFSQSITIDW